MYAQSKQEYVIVLPQKTDVPANAKKLGTIRLGNNATKLHCDYEALVASAKQKAKKMGGNVVKITQLVSPVFISQCYSIKAEVYYVKDLSDYDQARNTGSMASANTNYATIYLYRLADTTLALGYRVHVDNDSIICSVKSKSRDSVNVYKEGGITLWAETEKRQDLKLEARFGHSYYVRCGLQPGEIRMVPVLQLMDSGTGMAEYEKLKKKRKNTNVNYLQQIH